ncbi:hypothetical protein U14_00254 [Candidatus Moduliflexus flocculans]|uniref:Uncharacterized protein n=1 Tax=Candidatus Moduliflexus flocculans TaxID=1499966 RepID=A0A0S6VTV1_9BACT|nr:hypothetical protein U14_00254 [Candidatus Moduliflexus flocculans]
MNAFVQRKIRDLRDRGIGHLIQAQQGIQARVILLPLSLVAGGGKHS